MSVKTQPAVTPVSIHKRQRSWCDQKGMRRSAGLLPPIAVPIIITSLPGRVRWQCGQHRPGNQTNPVSCYTYHLRRHVSALWERAMCWFSGQLMTTSVGGHWHDSNLWPLSADDKPPVTTCDPSAPMEVRGDSRVLIHPACPVTRALRGDTLELLSDQWWSPAEMAGARAPHCDVTLGTAMSSCGARPLGEIKWRVWSVMGLECRPPALVLAKVVPLTVRKAIYKPPPPPPPTHTHHYHHQSTPVGSLISPKNKQTVMTGISQPSLNQVAYSAPPPPPPPPPPTVLTERR